MKNATQRQMLQATFFAGAGAVVGTRAKQKVTQELSLRSKLVVGARLVNLVRGLTFSEHRVAVEVVVLATYCNVILTRMYSCTHVPSRQMFKNTSADRELTPFSDTTNRIRAASVIQGTNGRTALQLLSQGSARQTAPRDNPETPPPRSDPAPSRLHDRMWCRMGASFVMIPAEGPPATEGAQRARPRRVFVREDCHLYRTTASLPAPDCVEPPTTPSGASAGWWSNAATLLEFPREGWALASCMTEGEGRWVAGDGLVYAPLFCSCAGCGSVPVGERAVGAGLHGQDLIGRAWFYPTRVHFEGIVLDETSPRELLLPAHVATIEHSRPPHV